MLSPDDARKVLIIAAHADGGCPVCVGALFKEIIKTWPELDWKEIAMALTADAGPRLAHYDEANAREEFLEFLEEGS